MVDQTQMKEWPASSAETATGGAGSGPQGVLHRIVLLAELQAELFWRDVRTSLQRLIVVGVLLCGTIAAGIAAVFLFMFFIAAILVGAGLHASWAFLLATIIDIVITIGMGVAAFLVLRSSIHVFQRSRDEWRRTVHWVKDSLSRTSTAGHNGKHL